MDFIKKNLAVVIVIVVIVLGLGGFVLWSRSSGGEAITPQDEESIDVKQVSPEDIGMTVEFRADGKAVILKLTKLAGIKSIEYEASYDAEETNEGETIVVPKGAVGSPIDVTGESEIEREVLLGTCSAAVCRYDKVMSDIKFLVKINFENGEVGAAEATLPIESE